MARIFITLAATLTTSAPLMAVDHGMAAPPAGTTVATPPIIGLDHPIFLQRMVVTATALPDAAL